MRFGVEAFRQCRAQARLADAGLAGDENHLAVARLGALPATQQKFDLLVAADQPAQRRAAQRLEPALYRARTQHLPSRHRRRDALQLDGAEIAVFEEIANQPAGARSDDDGAGPSQGLQPSGEVRRFSDDRLLLRRALADQIADYHQPSGDPDARLKRGGFDSESTDRVNRTEPCPDCALGIVLVRSRVAEVNQNAIPHILRDKSVEAPDDVG